MSAQKRPSWEIFEINLHVHIDPKRKGARAYDEAAVLDAIETAMSAIGQPWHVGNDCMSALVEPSNANPFRSDMTGRPE